jgi:hypothetical protein
MQFESIQSFKIWLTIEGYGELKEQVITLDSPVLEAFRAIYQKYSEPGEGAELHDIVSALGEAIAELMQLAVTLSTIADKKRFIRDNGFTLYSTMKQGIAQDDSNISRTLRPEGGDLDESLTDPIASQIIEGVLDAGPQYGIQL